MAKKIKMTRAKKIARNKFGTFSVNSRYAQKKRRQQKGTYSPNSPFHNKEVQQ
tara:strand:- start:251 stop:409 length:159 start_codon:yes stop_codon:yes gene_type:complete